MEDRVMGETIYLRLMTKEDTDSIIKWRNSDRVRKNFIDRNLFTVEGHERWIETMIKPGHAVQFLIVEKSTEKPIGSVYLRDIQKTHRKAEYGIFIGEETAAGKGYGTQAAKLMLQYGFDVLKLHKIYLRALAENKQAIRSYEKAGFQKEGFLRDEVLVDGSFYDLIWMAVINPKERDTV